jgi:hypothetical protein
MDYQWIKLYMFLCKLNVTQYEYHTVSYAASLLGHAPTIPANAIRLAITDLSLHYLVPKSRM